MQNLSSNYLLRKYPLYVKCAAQCVPASLLTRNPRTRRSRMIGGFLHHEKHNGMNRPNHRGSFNTEHVLYLFNLFQDRMSLMWLSLGSLFSPNEQSTHTCSTTPESKIWPKYNKQTHTHTGTYETNVNPRSSEGSHIDPRALLHNIVLHGETRLEHNSILATTRQR